MREWKGANCFCQNLYFSTITITTLGYGDYHPKPHFQLVAASEAAIGTFIWALFIIVFARKYMR
ncbi:MAG: two pore domain potassium channel family protein [Candidatus Helarchaeota archaeon]|nr:two pore domain potassium channel family protein [Candidatus Helarchaeota archaeon]